MDAQNPYEIPFEKAETIRGYVGKVVTGGGQRLEIVNWIGQNYTLRNLGTGKEATCPAMYIADQIKRGGLKAEH